MNLLYSPQAAPRARVALLRTTPAAVLDDYARLLDLLGAPATGPIGARVDLRLATTRRYPFPAANPPPWQLDAAIRAALSRGAARLYVSAAPVGMSPQLVDLNGYAAAGIRLLRAREPGAATPDPARSTGAVVLATLRRDPAALIGGALFQIAAESLVTMKAFRRLALAARSRSGVIDALIVDALAVHQGRYATTLALIDGTAIGNGAGAQPARPEVGGVLLASTDAVAADSIAALLMGYAPLCDVPYLRMAQERGLGVADPAEIELVGDLDLVTMRWRPPAPPAERRAAALFADDTRWPKRDREIFESWLYHTAWGRLFAEYQRRA